MYLHQLFSSKMFWVLGQVQWRWQHQKLYCSSDGLTKERGTALSVLGHKRKGDFESNSFSSSLYKLAAQTAAVAPSRGPKTMAQGQDKGSRNLLVPWHSRRATARHRGQTALCPSLPFLSLLRILIQWASVTYAFFLESIIKQKHRKPNWCRH